MVSNLISIEDFVSMPAPLPWHRLLYQYSPNDTYGWKNNLFCPLSWAGKSTVNEERLGRFETGSALVTDFGALVFILVLSSLYCKLDHRLHPEMDGDFAFTFRKPPTDSRTSVIKITANHCPRWLLPLNYVSQGTGTKQHQQTGLPQPTCENIQKEMICSWWLHFLHCQ